MKKSLLILAAGAALAATTACSSNGGGGGATPNEFRVVTKAPLSVPPEYSLRPPAAGTTTPAEVEAATTGVTTAFGTTMGVNASAAEKALVAAAGANAANAAVRAQVDYEEARAIRKTPSITDRVFFWRKDKPEDAASAATDNATGDQPVTIERTSGGPRIRLPGT
jgi:ABC-type phosphate/phosphonate transport system substrate-binding protein